MGGGGGGGGGGGDWGREADMPAVTALRYFHVCSWKVSLNVQKTEQKRCSSRHRAKEVYF